MVRSHDTLAGLLELCCRRQPDRHILSTTLRAVRSADFHPLQTFSVTACAGRLEMYQCCCVVTSRSSESASLG